MPGQVYFQSFCGKAVFWDSNLSWNTTEPRLTRCFHQTVLNWIPNAVLWIFSFSELLGKLPNRKGPIPLNCFNTSRLILSLICIPINLVQFFYTVYRYYNTMVPPIIADFSAPLFDMASFMLVSLFLHHQRLIGVPTSPLVWIYILLKTMAALPVCYQTWLDRREYSLLDQILFNAYTLVMVILLILCSRADHIAQDNPDDKSSPELGASFLSQITFAWFDELTILGWRKDLTKEDLWDLPKALKSATLSAEFEANLEKYLKSKKPSSSGIHLENFHASASNSTESCLPQRKPAVNIVPILSEILGSYFLVGSACKLVHDVLQFVTPQLLKLLIDFAEMGPDEPIWHGFLIAVSMFAISVIQILFLQNYFSRMFTTGMKTNTILTAAIYKKSLNLSAKTRKEVTPGEIINLMSIDSKRFMDIIPYINLLWSVPFQILSTIFFLYLELGLAAFSAIGIMMIILPMNLFIGYLNKKLEMEQMKKNDERLNFITQILAGIKIVKFYAWEQSFLHHVTSLRAQELNNLRKISYLDCVSNFFWICAPILVSVSSFAVHVLVQGETLTARKAFVSLALIQLLRFPLAIFPTLVKLYINALNSVQRINRFLNCEELGHYVTRNGNFDAIKVEDGEFVWINKKDTKAGTVSHKPRESLSKNNRTVGPCFRGPGSWKRLSTLRGINLTVERSAFVAIVGSVGSGKSSLVRAILGEMARVKGRVNIDGEMTIAYLPQQAWIRNSTLKQNILFGKPFEPEKYNQVIAACALDLDISYLPGLDETEIGEKGINLSGGQKQRVSLARACYSDSDLYLLDDPLSAVDAHVAKHLFHNVLSSETGILRTRTRVLVTNKLDILSKVDKIIVLKNGQITESGSYQDLMKSGGDFRQMISAFTDQEVAPLRDPVEEPMSPKKFQQQPATSTKSQEKAKLIESETAETGGVKWKVYGEYLRMVSFSWVPVILTTLFLSILFSLLADIWLSQWSEDRNRENVGINQMQQRLVVYTLFGGLQGAFLILGAGSLVTASLRVSFISHRDLLFSILRSPLCFFDTTPSGRIVTRFSQDMEAIDSRLPEIIRAWLISILQTAATFVIISLQTPCFILILIPILMAYAVIQRIYIASSRQLKRLESITRSPIYSHFSETLNGVDTIRAYNATERFITESGELVDCNNTCYYPSVISNRWLTTRLELCGSLINLCASILAVLARSKLTSSEIGLSISYAIGVTVSLSWLVRMASDLESNIVSFESVLDYCRLPSEADWFHGKIVPEDEWPHNGAVKFDKYQTRYREGTDLVLKNISVNIKPKEKIGIVGRTGAGKSTITLSMFRLIEPTGGSIHIDGYNISDLPLHHLRSRLAIIPQDPVLFSGSLRFNLDPFGTHSDEEIWNSLEHSRLKELVESLGKGLEYEIDEEGCNLSLGQRQLLCLARALLKKPKILFLDEATAAIDLTTDSIIQATIRSKFPNCTILTIAHRLNTIMDSDRVLVLDHGKVVEFDSPRNLLARKNSLFNFMARKANLVN